jgi:dimethylhistidine N-methyltransferase
MHVLDFHPDTDAWRQEVWEGLQKPQKELPSKLFYDERGSQLFEQICELSEYYPTRVEQAIMESHIEEMTKLMGERCLLIEYGSGSSQKTRTLLEHLPQAAGYVPIDISKEHLQQSAAAIAAAYPGLEVLPVYADYESDFYLLTPSNRVARRVAYYPGSTIGNFHPSDAVAFLRQIRNTCGPESDLLIGVDLKKDKDILHDAYNDRAGVTADFNLNILARLNRELGANFALEQFQHEAFYNEAAGRIEMHLVSLCEQTAHLNGRNVSFDANERIWTESSYKYTLHEFAGLAKQAGLQPAKVWTDPERLFSVQYLTPTPIR